VHPSVGASIFFAIIIAFFLLRSIAESGLVWNEIPREALFLAGKAYLSYRRTGGPRTAPLSDFFIGAHAAVSGLVLITRDPERIRKHFPRVRLLCPDPR